MKTDQDNPTISEMDGRSLKSCLRIADEVFDKDSPE